MVIARQAVGVGEVRVDGADLVRLRGHHRGELVDGARDVLRDSDRRIVAGVHHHAVEQVAHADLLARLEPERRALRAGGIAADRHHVIHVGMFERQDERHDLRRAGREAALVLIALVDDLARCGIDDDSRARRQILQWIIGTDDESRDIGARHLLDIIDGLCLYRRGSDLWHEKCQSEPACEQETADSSLFQSEFKLLVFPHFPSKHIGVKDKSSLFYHPFPLPAISRAQRFRTFPAPTMAVSCSNVSAASSSQKFSRAFCQWPPEWKNVA